MKMMPAVFPQGPRLAPSRHSAVFIKNGETTDFGRCSSLFLFGQALCYLRFVVFKDSVDEKNTVTWESGLQDDSSGVPGSRPEK